MLIDNISLSFFCALCAIPRILAYRPIPGDIPVSVSRQQILVW